MSVYKITALKIGSLYAEKSSLTMGIDYGKPVEIPMWSAAVEGNGIKALVDTGIHDIEWVRATVGDQYRVTQEEDEPMEKALAMIGWKPEDVNVVVNTHLHYDHAGCNYMFKNATFYTQRTEWEYSFDAIENQKVYYAQFLYDWRAVKYTSWKMLDGEYEIAPGFVVIPLPGHTPGVQGALVTTEEGVVCIAGDSANLAENVNDNLLANIIWDCEMGYKTLDTIRTRANMLLGGHEGTLKKYQTSGFPKLY
jgi:glyoxylase-like metal-dependent hydrolase (beta-lactamase superfamily II)